MKERIKIGATKHLDTVFQALNRDFKVLRERGFNIDLLIQNSGKYHSVECIMDFHPSEPVLLSDERYHLCFRQIANAVAEVITGKWEEDMVQDVVNDSYFDFTVSERERIHRRAMEILQGPAGMIGVLNRKKTISDRLNDYLKGSNELMIDGFINFRLKDYREKLEQVVTDAVEEFLLEREYDDFIGLLKYFVETQEAKLEKVHVVLRPSGVFDLYDEDFRLIDNDYLEGFILDLMDNDLSYEDLLISALITIAPKKVILHLLGSREIGTSITTIQGVFEDRTTICLGCPKCLQLSEKKS